MIEPQHVKLELGSLNSTVVSEEQTFTFNPGKPNLIENPGKFNLTWLIMMKILVTLYDKNPGKP
jgi:hypothetical protein